MLQDFKIQNVVASCDVKFPIRLEGLAFSHGMFCSVSGTFPSRANWPRAACGCVISCIAVQGHFHGLSQSFRCWHSMQLHSGC